VERFNCIRRKILEITSRSEIPEDRSHPENTLKWLLTIYPEADLNLRIAALGHDIERALPDRKVIRDEFDNFDDFKRAHAENSAKVIKGLLKECGFQKEDIEDICELIRRHEFGGTERSDRLRIADALSFFDNNLPYYFKRHDKDEVKRRIVWGLKRLPSDIPGIKECLLQIRYKDNMLNELFRECLRIAEEDEKL